MTTEAIGNNRSAQAEYYEATANQYNAMHVNEGDEHFVAMEYMLGLFVTLSIGTVLDVGCGTGRAIRFIADRRPGVEVYGIEPVAALLHQAASGGGKVIQGSGDRLPFADGSFDAVCSTALLHHVPQPDLVVAEMCRVARKGVFISDGNRFGHRPPAVRVVKLVAWRLGLWGTLNHIQTRGRGYRCSEGDGVSYSYSVYDSMPLLSSWADRVLAFPTSPGSSGTWLGPLLSSEHVLVAAVKEPDGPGWAGR